MPISDSTITRLKAEHADSKTEAYRLGSHHGYKWADNSHYLDVLGVLHAWQERGLG